MPELSIFLLGIAGLAGVVVLVEAKLLRAIRLGKAIAGEFKFKKNHDVANRIISSLKMPE